MRHSFFIRQICCFFCVDFLAHYYRVSVDATAQKKTRNRHSICAIAYFSRVVYMFFGSLVNSLERFHFLDGVCGRVSVCHMSVATAAAAFWSMVCAVRFGVNIFYLFIFQLTIHWSDLFCVSVRAPTSMCVQANVRLNLWFGFTQCVSIEHSACSILPN